MDKLGTDEAECSRKVEGGRRELKWARVLHGSLLMSVLTYDSETMIWREKKRSRIRAVQMDNK